MKKLFFTVLVILAMGCTQKSLAQSTCREIVRPYYIMRDIDSTTYPIEKEEYFCQFSRNAFFITRQVPEGAVVHDLDELTNVLTRTKASKNMEIDLNKLSYWLYDFYRFTDNRQTAYFRIGKRSDHQYLGVRTYNEAQARTEHPEMYKD